MKELVRLAVSFTHLHDKTQGLKDGWPGHGETYKPSFSEGPWRKSSVVGTLLAMHGRVCAYCTGQLTQSDRGDVEHFRPKSEYWWLAYKFENYVLSCARCNRVRKGKKFPLAVGETALAYRDGRPLDDEKRLLLDPSLDQVEQLITLKLTKKVWRLKPAQSEGHDHPQAKETIRFFGLDREQLPVERHQAIADATDEAQRIRVHGGSRRKFHGLASRYNKYGIFIQRVLRKSYADLLPTRTQEVQLFVADLRGSIAVHDETLAEYPGDPGTMDLRQQALWTLVTLWRHPPVGATQDQVSRWIGDQLRLEVSQL